MYMQEFIAIEYKNNKLLLIDQRKLPTINEKFECTTYQDVEVHQP